MSSPGLVTAMVDVRQVHPGETGKGLAGPHRVAAREHSVRKTFDSLQCTGGERQTCLPLLSPCEHCQQPALPLPAPPAVSEAPSRPPALGERGWCAISTGTPALPDAQEKAAGPQWGASAPCLLLPAKINITDKRHDPETAPPNRWIAGVWEAS